jgi:alkaline phosphatase
MRAARINGSGWNRRQFLAFGTAVAAGAVLSKGSAQTEPGSPAAKNVIFAVSDGMSTGVLDLAEQFSRLVRGKGTRWVSLMKDPRVVAGLQETHSLDSPVTDSAAAAAAWGSGCRGFNGMINEFPGGRQLVPIAKLLKDKGKSVGFVTTATVTHATPAGFAACVPLRSMEHEIARQYLAAGIDVILGGGRQFFEKTAEQTDLLKAYGAAGYSLAGNRAEMEAANSGKFLGLFHRGHLPYTIDTNNLSAADNPFPTLEAMTRKALRILAKNKEGFLCQIEAARVDHAAHGNDAAGLLWEQLAFDDAVGAALDFASENGETLVVVLSDHGNANPGLNGCDEGYKKSGQFFRQLTEVRASAEEIAAWIRAEGEGLPAAGFVRGFQARAGFAPSPGEREILIEASREDAKPANWSSRLSNFSGLYGQISGNHNGIGWTGVAHTSDHTLLTATGPGQELFAGLQRNDAVFGHLCTLLGVSHINEPFSGSVDGAASQAGSEAGIRQAPEFVA